MKNVIINQRQYKAVEFKPFIVDNLSQFGCIIFFGDKYKDFDFGLLKKQLASLDKALENMELFPLNVYDEENDKLYVYYTLVNKSPISSIVFFDLVRIACKHFKLSDFCACDFNYDRVYAYSRMGAEDIGRLSELKNILKLSDKRYIVVKVVKWASPPGYKYFREAEVFRNDVEREYYHVYGNNNQAKIYYSLDECEANLIEKYCYDFKEPTILDFDIDNENLTIKATKLKAKNLNVKNIYAKDELYCYMLTCDNVEAHTIVAESITCRNMSANRIKTNFEYGIK